MQQCTWEWSVRQNLTRNGGKVHRTLGELWIDVQASSTGYFFLGWGIWLPSNKNIAPVLFDYNWLSAEWCNSPAKSYFFFLWVYTLCVFLIWLASDDTRWINAIFLSFQVPLFSLWIHSSFQYLFSPSLLLSLFSTSRRVLLYSFVILIDCINLLSIEFPVHHAEHNVEYYHNPSK